MKLVQVWNNMRVIKSLQNCRHLFYCAVNLTGHRFCGPFHKLKVEEGKWSLVVFSYLHCEGTISLHPSPVPAHGPSPVHAPSLCPGLCLDPDPVPFLFPALSLDCSKECEGSSGLPDHDCDLLEENNGSEVITKKYEMV